MFKDNPYIQTATLQFLLQRCLLCRANEPTEKHKILLDVPLKVVIPNENNLLINSDLESLRTAIIKGGRLEIHVDSVSLLHLFQIQQSKNPQWDLLFTLYDKTFKFKRCSITNTVMQSSNGVSNPVYVIPFEPTWMVEMCLIETNQYIYDHKSHLIPKEA